MLMKDALKEYEEIKYKNPELWENFETLDKSESYWRDGKTIVICNSKETLKMDLNGTEPFFKNFGEKTHSDLDKMGFEKISFATMKGILDRRQIELNRPSWDAFKDFIDSRESNKPSHTIYEVLENKWNKVGVAWTNKNNSLSLKVERDPIDGATLQIKPNHKQAINSSKDRLPNGEIFAKRDGVTKKIGAAWQNKDGSQNLILKDKGLKISGTTIYLREIKKQLKPNGVAMRLQQRRQQQGKENTLSR